MLICALVAPYWAAAREDIPPNPEAAAECAEALASRQPAAYDWEWAQNFLASVEGKEVKDWTDEQRKSVPQMLKLLASFMEMAFSSPELLGKMEKTEPGFLGRFKMWSGHKVSRMFKTFIESGYFDRLEWDPVKETFVAAKTPSELDIGGGATVRSAKMGGLQVISIEEENPVSTHGFAALLGSMLLTQDVKPPFAFQSRRAGEPRAQAFVLARAVPSEEGESEPQWLPGLLSRFLDHVWEPDYRDRLKMRELWLARLREITESLAPRSFVAVMPRDPFVFDNEGNAAFGKKDSSPEIAGGAVIVISGSPEEPVPLELFPGADGNTFRVARKPGERIGEIGRLSVFRDARLNTPRFVAFMAAVLLASGWVDRVVIEADAMRKSIFSKFGFQVMDERKNAYNGGAEYLMWVDTTTLATEAIQRELGSDLTDEAFWQ